MPVGIDWGKAFRGRGSLWKLESIFPLAGEERAQSVSSVFWPLGSRDNYSAIWTLWDDLQDCGRVPKSPFHQAPGQSACLLLTFNFFSLQLTRVRKERGTLDACQWTMGDNEAVAKCYGKSLKSLGQENTIIGYIFLDHSDHCKENRWYGQEPKQGTQFGSYSVVQERDTRKMNLKYIWGVELTDNGSKLKTWMRVKEESWATGLWQRLSSNQLLWGPQVANWSSVGMCKIWDVSEFVR